MNTDQFFTACIRDPTNQLVAAECLALTGTSPAADGIALGGSIDAVAHAAYINYGARLLARGNSIDELAANIGRLDLDLDGFRLDIERIGHTPWAERRQTIVAVADALKNCYPNLSNPRHRIIVVERDEELLCGQILTQTDRSYRQHDDKPHRTSASLPSRLARASPCTFSVLRGRHNIEPRGPTCHRGARHGPENATCPLLAALCTPRGVRSSSTRTSGAAPLAVASRNAMAAHHARACG